MSDRHKDTIKEDDDGPTATEAQAHAQAEADIPLVPLKTATSQQDEEDVTITASSRVSSDLEKLFDNIKHSATCNLNETPMTVCGFNAIDESEPEPKVKKNRNSPR